MINVKNALLNFHLYATIEYAVKENYSHVIIMGGDELSAGQVKIKDLLTREEKTVAIEEMGSAI